MTYSYKNELLHIRITWMFQYQIFIVFGIDNQGEGESMFYTSFQPYLVKYGNHFRLGDQINLSNLPVASDHIL